MCQSASPAPIYQVNSRTFIRDGARGRFFNVVDLANRLEADGRSGRQGRMADYLSRMDFIVLDELGYLPFAQSAASDSNRRLRLASFVLAAGRRSSAAE